MVASISIKHKYFYLQFIIYLLTLNCCKYFYQTQIFLFTIYHLLAHIKWLQVFLCIPNNLIYVICLHSKMIKQFYF